MKRVDGSDGLPCASHKWVWAGWRYPDGSRSYVVVKKGAKSFMRCVWCGTERDRWELTA